MGKLRDMKIGKKLGLGFGVLLVLLLAMTVAAIWGLSAMNGLKEQIVAEAGKAMLAASVRDAARDIGLREASIILLADRAQKEEMQRSLQPIRARYSKQMDELKEGTSSQLGREKLSAIEQAITATRESNLKLQELALAGKSKEAGDMFIAHSAPLMEKLYAAVDDFSTWREKQMTEAVARADAVHSTLRWMLILGGGLALALAGFFGVTLTHSIVRPIRKGVDFAASMSKGDMTQNLNIEQKDEIGELAGALNDMGHSMRKVVGDIRNGIETLASSSGSLSDIAAQMATGVMEMSHKAGTVAAAAEESSANTASVAAGMEQMTGNLTAVAGATEQMSATIGEIASNSEKARAISDAATQQAEAVTIMMKELGRAAQEIGHVTETITSISAQTNLLALNATIEAARAGSAGKGFAVVANEIKELAQQTASATEDIKGRIASMQASTGGAIGDIEKISQVIKEVGEIVATIAAAIEEQSVVTRDVASNIAQASMGLRDSNERVSQTATVSQSIAHDITRVSATIDDVSHGGEQVQASSAGLSGLAEQLKSLVETFRV